MIFPAIAAVAASLAVFMVLLTATGTLSPEGRRWRQRAATLERATAPAGAGGPVGNALRDQSLSGSSSINAVLQRFTWAPQTASLLERADLPLKVSEYILIQVALAAVIGVLATLMSGLWLVGVGFAIASILIVRIWVSSRASRRLNAFNQQLPLALHTMATSLRSGFSIMEAIRTVAREMEHPLSTEFRRMLDETRLGGSFEESMARMSERVKSEDLQIVTRALDIHRRIGGDLAAILESVGKTMREREELRGHVRALTAQQRFGGMLVGLMPIWVIGFLAVTAPDFISPLWEETVGRWLLVIGISLEIVGFFIMRQVLKIEV